MGYILKEKATSIGAAFLLGTLQVTSAAADPCDLLRDLYLNSRPAQEQRVAKFEAAVDELASRLAEAKRTRLRSLIFGIPLSVLGTLMGSLGMLAATDSASSASPAQLAGGSVVIAAGGISWIYFSIEKVERLEALLRKAVIAREQNRKIEESDRRYFEKKWAENNCPDLPYSSI